MPTYAHITVERSHQDKIATITMRRPEVHNAFNKQLILDLMAAFTDLVTDTQLHAVVLTGEGPSFSAGADLNMMRESAVFTHEQNLNDALRLAVNVQHEVAVAATRALRADRLLDAFEGGMLERAETALRVAEKSYRAGAR